MSLITNRSFLYVNCLSVDVSLKILLSLSEWFNACVATERIVSVIKGTVFDKNKSRKMYTHDLIYRELIEDIDIDEKRIWCFIKYSSSMNIYNSFISLLHFQSI
jgi:hypothetical protein